MPRTSSRINSGCATMACCWLVLVLGIVGAELNANDLKREHSLVKPYHGSGMTIPYWNLQGNTLVTNNFVRLTSDIQSQRGTIWNTMPCTVRNWEVQITFKVYGKGKDLFGDGLAIWYAKEPNQPGPVFGSKDFFNGLVVILDTYSNHNGVHNHQHPYISAMVNNGTLHYDHDRDGTHTQLAGCEAKFRNLDHDTHISIRYEKDTLTVSTDFSNKGAWNECFTVNQIQLPTGYYFGVTATTGDLSDNHAIVSFKVYQLYSPDDTKDKEDRSQIIPSAAYFESPRDHIDDPKPSSLGGIKIFFLMLIGALAIIACVVIGIMLYQKHQEQSRKRFY